MKLSAWCIRHTPLLVFLNRLAKLKSLEYLYLGCRCTDAGLQGLAGAAAHIRKCVLLPAVARAECKIAADASSDRIA